MKRRVLCVCMAIIMATTGSVSTSVLPVMAAKKMKLNKSKATVYVNKSVALRVSGTKKTVKWSTNNSQVVSVKKKGKTAATVKAKNVGTAKVYAKIGSKKLVCNVKVKKKITASVTPTLHPEAIVTSAAPATTTTTTTTIPSTVEMTAQPSNIITASGGSIEYKAGRHFQYHEIDTSRPVEDLGVDFYLEPFEEGKENNQWVYLIVKNSLSVPVYIEPEAYLKTDGVCYPAMNYACRDSGKDLTFVRQIDAFLPQGAVQTDSPRSSVGEDETPAPQTTEEADSAEPRFTDSAEEDTDISIFNKKQVEISMEADRLLSASNTENIGNETLMLDDCAMGKVTYDSYDYVSGYCDAADDYSYYWLPSNASSILIFYFRVNNKRYMAVVNYQENGAKIYEASEDAKLITVVDEQNPNASAAPSLQSQSPAVEATSTPRATGTVGATQSPRPTGTARVTQSPRPTATPTSTPDITDDEL
ncbi:MAG: hypothetical protein II073_03820 [Lachnospiraceae bacterium]|nr:hypothetical protein [Lachnospiraceae bacterium]